MTVTRFRNHTLVQVAATWPAASAGWTTIFGWAEQAADGLANDVGCATIVHPAGLVRKHGATTASLVEPQDLCGQYVRICLEDTAGSVVGDTPAKRFEPIWYGKIMSRSWKPNSDQTGMDVEYECAGLEMILDQMVPFRHYHVAGGGYAEITTPPAFNGRGAQRVGNRSAATRTIGGMNVFVFDTTPGGVPADEWTAKDVVEYLLALAKDTNPGGPSWYLAGDTTSLEYVDKWDISGLTILEAISKLINPRQGLGYRLEMDGIDATIHVVTMTDTAVSAGGYTLAASAEQVALDLTVADEIIDFSITEDQTATYGKVAIIGGPQAYILTLMADGDGTGQLIPDWDASEEADWQTALDDGDPPQGELKKPFRRFKLREDWDGENHDGTFTMPSARSTETNDLHGDAGLNGEVTTGGTLMPGDAFKFTRDLPVPSGYAWESEDPTTVDLTRKPEEPLVFVKLASGEWMTLAEYCDERDSVQIDIDDDASAITFGPADVAEYIRDLFASGGELYVTLGIECQLPLMVSWVRPDPEPVEQARSISRLRQSMTRTVITEGSVFAVENGVPAERSAEVEVRSDLDKLKAVLALAVAWYANPNWTVNWTQRGIIGSDFGRPGTFYTEVTYRDGDSGTATVATATVVTRRDWNFADGVGSTRLTTKRIQLDLDTVF